jgi:Gram-negative bacterial TonB protein C-terminal
MFRTEPEPRRTKRTVLWVILGSVAVGLLVWVLRNWTVAGTVATAAVGAVRQAIDPSASPLPAESPASAPASAANDAARPASRSRAEKDPRRATSPAGPASPAGVPPDPAAAPPARVTPAGPVTPMSPSMSIVVPPTYDGTSIDVVPPKLRTPTASAPLRPESRRDANAIEVTVNEDGTVESVKSTTRPSTLAEAIRVINGLSIASTWRFSPAMKNGQPVKYRLRVPLSMF